jgi:hypothetical protein
MRSNGHLFLFLIPAILVLGNLPQNKSYAMSGTNAKPKSSFIDHEQSENEKAKKFKVKIRYKYAALYDKSGKHIQKKSLAEKAVFNRDGTMKELTRFTGLGVVDFKYVFTYDKNGNLIAAETLNSTSNLTDKRTSKYDKNGNEVERLIFDSRHPGAKKTEYIYDGNNNLIETKNFSTSDQLVSDQISTYENGLLKNLTTKNFKGQISDEMFYEYDQAGRLIKEYRKMKTGNYAQTYTYDKKGNMTEADNPGSKRLCTYNERNELIEDRLFKSDGQRQFRVRFNYLNNGLQKEEIRYDNDDKAVLYSETKYEYYK